MDPTATVSPTNVVTEIPWPMALVLWSGVFSATAWGLATLFRPRPSFARSPDPEPPEPADDPPPDDAPREP